MSFVEIFIMSCRRKSVAVRIITLAGLMCAITIYAFRKPVNKTTTLYPAEKYLVPNFVHFLRFGPEPLTFMDAVCILAALKNQRPDKLFVHTDVKNFSGGKYWDIVSSHKTAQGIVELKYRPVGYPERETTEMPNLFVEKLKVLMTYGGIYLDRDTYLVKDLNFYRRFQVTIGKLRHQVIPDYVILAAKEAEFLRLWLSNYSQKGASWFFNLRRNAVNQLHLFKVKLMEDWLADSDDVIEQIYLDNSGSWVVHRAIHLFTDLQYLIPRNLSHSAKFPVVFNETNIQNYHVDLKEMVLDVYPTNNSKFDLSKSWKRLRFIPLPLPRGNTSS